MATNKEIVETALSFKGKLKYDFGGDNIAGGSGDCSDFTQYVYALHGYEIGGYTGSQIEQGQPVLKSDLLPGDLVFFHGTNPDRKGVSHVGIYIGDDKFIDLGNDGCNVDSLNSYYWTKHYMDARRINGVTYIDFDTAGLRGSVADDSAAVDGVTTPVKKSIAGLEWWGDIVKIVLIILLLIAGVVLTASSVGVKLKGVLPNG